VRVLKHNGVPVPGDNPDQGQRRCARTARILLPQLLGNGRRIQRPVGTSTREAKDVWYRQRNPAYDAETQEVEAETGSQDVPVATGLGLRNSPDSRSELRRPGSGIGTRVGSVRTEENET